MDKAQVLSQLRRAIIEELCVKQWRDVWFFPERDEVKGWYGAAPIMFAGLNPSMGTFSSKADRFLLYKYISQNGLSDAHITDLLKIRLKGKLVQEGFDDTELVQLHKAWLMEEVRLLDPNLIVALSRTTFKYLKAWLPNNNSRIEWIHHYAWADRYRKEAVFAQDVANIRDKYIELKGKYLPPNQGVQGMH
jgi:hypothetical protein